MYFISPHSNSFKFNAIQKRIGIKKQLQWHSLLTAFIINTKTKLIY